MIKDLYDKKIEQGSGDDYTKNSAMFELMGLMMEKVFDVIVVVTGSDKKGFKAIRSGFKKV